MKRKPTKGESFVKFPAALITVLSDTATRILNYAIDRQGLVITGTLKHWELSPTDVENQFKGKIRGYSRNTIRNGFRELRKIRLIEFKGNFYHLNTVELNRWMLKPRTYVGMPNSGGGGCQNLAGAPLPKSGSQEKKSLEKKSKREERAIRAESPVVKTPAENFADVFGVSTPVEVKSLEQNFDEIFSGDSAGGAT